MGSGASKKNQPAKFQPAHEFPKSHPKDDIPAWYGDPTPPPLNAVTYKPLPAGSTIHFPRLTTSVRPDDDVVSSSDISNAPSFDFRDIDEHAREATAAEAHSFDQLVQYLQLMIADPDDRELWTVRAILIWMSERESESFSSPWEDRNSPFGYLSLIRENKASYAELFTTLCRKAGLKCVTVHGQVKAAMYQPGDVNLPEASWNAVQINGNWHLVQPYWTCKCLAGYQAEGLKKLLVDGTVVSPETIRPSRGMYMRQFNDFYFLVRPEAFIYEACPYDTRWQLLPPSVTRTMEEFHRQANLLRSFVLYGLKLVSVDACVYQAHNGVCTIVIKADKAIANKLYVKYILYAIDLLVDKDELYESAHRQKFVFNERSNDKFRFEIRFPVEGTFKISIAFGRKVQGGDVQYSECCSFRLECTERQYDCKPLPIDVGDVGWGPGPHAEDVGLCKPSETNGRVYVPPKDVLDSFYDSDSDDEGKEVLFDIDQYKIDKYNFDAKLTTSETYGCDIEGEVGIEKRAELQWCVRSKVDKSRKQLAVHAKLPKAGEYALSILASQSTESKSVYKPVCNYLLTTEPSQEQEAQQKDALENLQKVLGTGNVPKLTEGVRRCEETGVEDSNPILSAGRNELRPILRRAAALKDLRHYMKGEDVDKLENAYKRCCDTGVDDQQLLSAAKKRIEYLRAKKEARDTLTSTVEHWYYRDLEVAINGFRKFCKGPQDEEKVKEAESLKERRRAFDAKLLVQIARPTGHSVESFKKALLTPGPRRDSLMKRLRDNLGNLADPDFENGLKVLISEAEKLMQGK